jgi:hypothetical protein
MDTTPEALAAHIQHVIQNTFGNCQAWEDEQLNSNPYWTQKLKEVVKALGDQLGYDVRMTEPGDTNWEFLYDICFLDTKDTTAKHDGYFRSDNYITRLILALESEWSEQLDEILYDFSKLLLSRASLNVMVCYQGSTQGVQRARHSLQEAIQSYAQNALEDRYLLCIFDWSDKTFAFFLLDGPGSVVRSQ